MTLIDTVTRSHKILRGGGTGGGGTGARPKPPFTLTFPRESGESPVKPK